MIATIIRFLLLVLFIGILISIADYYIDYSYCHHHRHPIIAAIAASIVITLFVVVVVVVVGGIVSIIAVMKRSRHRVSIVILKASMSLINLMVVIPVFIGR